MKNLDFEAQIEGYTKRGFGKAFVESNGTEKALEVKGAILGETVSVKCFGKRKKTYKAKLLEVLLESHDRVSAKCQHALECGGCTFQHLSYQKQLEIKQSKIEKLYENLFDPEKISKIVSAEPIFHYRNKMEYSFSQDREGNKYLGLMKSGAKGRVLNLQECHLVNAWQAKLLNAIRSYWETSSLRAYHPYKDEGTFQTLILREGLNTGQKLVMLTVSGRSGHGMTKSQIEEFKTLVTETLGKENLSIYLRVRQAVKGQPTQYFEMHLHGLEFIEERLRLKYPSNEEVELTFAISPSSFFQPNTAQAERLFSKALELVDTKKEMKILDLYCGTGTLGLVFSKLAKQVISVEINPYSVYDGIENAKRNGISNVSFYKGDTKVVLPELKEKKLLDNIDLVILDPPRAGLDEKSIKQVIEISPNQILYISCNPETQVNDVSHFVEAGYRIKHICPVDQFPQTPHIENIVVLVKR